MIFALLHATLGWSLASLASFALRRHSASLRCWAWRLGLLKGPLAFLAALPVVVPSAPTPAIAPIPLPSREIRVVSEARQPVAIDKAPALRPEGSKLFIDPLLIVYGLGTASAIAARLVSARRPHRAMPRVVGVLRPRVVMPSGLSPEAHAMALAHEQAHIRRRDPLWSLMADLVCTAFWFAPPVWLCARAMRAESEAACDALALTQSGASRRDYARLLLTFAGPAPANALGGPARRLARRILMLEKDPRSLSRPRLGGSLVVAFVALLPWQAVAAQEGPEAGPLKAAKFHPAIKFSLEDAAKEVLCEPGVGEQVGWTDAQERAVLESSERWNRSFRDFGNRLYRLKNTMTLREWQLWDARERPKAFARAGQARGSYPWTQEQEYALKSLALARFGSAVWKDPEVANRLRLTKAQLAAVTRENVAIMALFTTPDGHPIPLAPPKAMPQATKTEIDRLTQLYLDAPLGNRQALNAKIWALKAPYQTETRGNSIDALRSGRDRSVVQSWAMRAAADRRLTDLLTSRQRATLQELKRTPDAWKRPYAYSESGSSLDLHGLRWGGGTASPGLGGVDRGIVQIGGTRYTIWRRAHAAGGTARYDYSISATPASRK